MLTATLYYSVDTRDVVIVVVFWWRRFAGRPYRRYERRPTVVAVAEDTGEQHLWRQILAEQVPGDFTVRPAQRETPVQQKRKGTGNVWHWCESVSLGTDPVCKTLPLIRIRIQIYTHHPSLNSALLFSVQWQYRAFWHFLLSSRTIPNRQSTMASGEVAANLVFSSSALLYSRTCL